MSNKTCTCAWATKKNKLDKGFMPDGTDPNCPQHGTQKCTCTANAEGRRVTDIWCPIHGKAYFDSLPKKSHKTHFATIRQRVHQVIKTAFHPLRTDRGQFESLENNLLALIESEVEAFAEELKNLINFNGTDSLGKSIDQALAERRKR